MNGLLEVVAGIGDLLSNGVNDNSEVLDDLGDLDTGNVSLGEVVEIDELFAFLLLHHF